MRIRREQIALAQGLYYGATGLWPLVSRRSFEAVTGRKEDWWLVETLGLLLLPVGGALARAGARGRVTPEVELLGAGAAAALGATDVLIAARRYGTPAYLLDALVSGGIAVAWAASRRV